MNAEISVVIYLLGYATLFVVGVRVFGIRNLLWAIGLAVFLAVGVALRTLAVAIGGRRC